MAFSLVWQDNSVNTANASSYSFTSQAFGAVADAGETRAIVVATYIVSTVDNADVTAIGGVAPTDHILLGTGDLAGRIESALVPTGTTGTVDVDGTSSTGCGIDVYRMIDALNHAVAFATSEDNAHASGVIDLSLNVPTGGGAVLVAQSQTAGTTIWSGATEVSDIDITGGGSDRISGASTTTAGTPRTITATNSDTTPTSYVGGGVSWAPIAEGQPTWKRWGGVQFMGGPRASMGGAVWGMAA